MAAKGTAKNLSEYAAKRDFAKTPEPAPDGRRRPRPTPAPTFMVHKHDATRLHYDVRLEIDGALASWAVPKGPSFDPAVKRLAVETEDHPLEYGGFEGRIPDDEYGGGDSLIWDRGTYETVPPGGAAAQRRKGHLELVLRGEKLRGRWHLIRTRGDTSGKNQWLLFKAKDELADPALDIVAERPESVVSGRVVTRGPESKRLRGGPHPKPERLLERVWPPKSATRVPAAKHHGVRAVAALSKGRVALVTPKALDLSARFPSIARALAEIDVAEAVIDGAVVAHRSTPSRSKRTRGGGGAVFVASDLLWVDGEDLRERPLAERRDLLVSVLSNAPDEVQIAERATRARRTDADKPELTRWTSKGRRGESVALTHPEKVLWPRDGITKQDLADYFQRVAPAMLRALAQRPLTLQHWRQGIDGPALFQQDVSRLAPSWIHVVETPARTRAGSVAHPVADRPEVLRWLAQHAALTIHTWASREGSLESPDWLVFDLDPADGNAIEQAVRVALVLRRALEDVGLPSFPKTSGQRGLHLLVPLAPGHGYDEVERFAVTFATGIARLLPEVTLERARAKRRGRLYLDCLQNGYGKTIVAPYSPRAVDGAPVSAPLRWSEVGAKLDPAKFSLRTMPARLDRVGDLFAEVLTQGSRLPKIA